VNDVKESVQASDFQRKNRSLACVVTRSQKGGKAAALGLEPAAYSSEVIDSVGGCKIASPPLTHGLTHDSELMRIVALWAELPDALRAAIGSIVDSFTSAAVPRQRQNTSINCEAEQKGQS
jgi:Tfp pilus assembly protein PilV